MPTTSSTPAVGDIRALHAGDVFVEIIYIVDMVVEPTRPIDRLVSLVEEIGRRRRRRARHSLILVALTP
jgi:hypothetical protein